MIQLDIATCSANHRSKYDRHTHTLVTILALPTNSIFASFNDTFVHVTDMSGKETVTRVTGKSTLHDIVLCMHQSGESPLATTKAFNFGSSDAMAPQYSRIEQGRLAKSQAAQKRQQYRIAATIWHYDLFENCLMRPTGLRHSRPCSVVLS